MISSDNKLNELLALLKLDFLEQVKQDCFELENLFLAMPISKDVDEDLNKIYRIIHNLKGAGGTHGLPLITAICHLFEDILCRSRKFKGFDTKLLDKSLQLIDLLRFAVSEFTNEESIISKIDAIRNSLKEKNVSIMVLDSSKTISMLLEKAFSDMPVNLTIISDGIQALSRLIHEPINVIIASNNISSISGYAVVAAIKENDSINSDVPVLFFSDKLINQKAEYSNIKFFKKNAQLIQQLTAEVKKITG